MIIFSLCTLRVRRAAACPSARARARAFGPPARTRPRAHPARTRSLADAAPTLFSPNLANSVVYNLRDPKYSFLQSSYMENLLLDEEFPNVEVYKSFRSIKRVDEFWTYMTEVFPPQMFSDQGAGPGVAYGTNYLVGAVRLRQVRVKPALCPVQKAFHSVLRNCYGRYSIGDEDRSPYGPGSRWTFRSCDELGSVCSQYAFLRRYDGGGYVIDLINGTSDGETARLIELRDMNWIDLQTRAVFIDFTMYNPSVNQFFVGQLTFEFLPSGGIIPGNKFRLIRLYRYEGASGTAQMVGEIAVVVFVLLFFIEEFVQMVLSCKRKRRNNVLKGATGTIVQHVPYFSDAWNYVDWLNIIVFIAAFFCRWRVDSKFFALDVEPAELTRYFDFTAIVSWDSAEKILLACNAFLLWFKVFKFAVVFSPRMGMIAQVVGKALFPLLFFIVMFLFVLMGFAQAGAIAFGADVVGYDTIAQSIFTVLLSVLGQRDFDALRHSNRLVGPLYFFTFIVIVLFIAMSMFLAIVDSSYEEVAADMKQQKEPSVFTKALVWFSSTKLGTRLVRALDIQSQVSDLRDAVEKGDLNKDGLVSEKELSLLLASRPDYFEGAAAELMDKYDIDNDNVLSPDERSRLFFDVQAEAVRLARNMAVLDDCPKEEYRVVFDLLSDRVHSAEARIERLAQMLLNKVDAPHGDTPARS